MGSLPSLPRPAMPPPTPENYASGRQIYASFCVRDPALNTKICNWIQCYNPLDNTWSYATSIPGLFENHLLKGFAMVSVGFSIYIIGGRLCLKERAHVCDGSDEFVELDLEVLKSVLRYNVRTKEWSRCALLGTQRYDFACTVCENKIYVAGGKSTLTSARGISSAEVYDADLDMWTPLPNMGTLRYKCVGVTWEGKIHVVGGFAERWDSDGSQPFMMERSSAEVFDTRAGKWDLKARMWQLDVPPNQIVALDERLYSSGDCLNAWKGHIEAYDGELNIWTIVDGSHLRTFSAPASTSAVDNKEILQPMRRLYLTMAPIGNHLYFLAGYQMDGDSARTMSMVHTFDTAAVTSNSWTSIEPMEEEGEKELCSHCCVVQIS